MTFDIFNRLTETTGRPCTRDVFYNISDGDKVARLWRQCQEAAARGDKKRVDELKRQLPFITWQASFADHRRSNANAIPSGLFMLDVDKVENPAEFRENVIRPAIANAKQLGIVAIHLSPSQRGWHFVAKCPAGMTTIEGCQRWLTAQLGIMTYDETCKDFARGSFAVPLAAYDYIDNVGLWEEEPINVLPNTNRLTDYQTNRLADNSRLADDSRLADYQTNRLADNSRLADYQTNRLADDSRGSGSDAEVLSDSLTVCKSESLKKEVCKSDSLKKASTSPQTRTFTDAQRTFKYRGHLISEIAAKWVEKHGTPQQGERHTYYYRLCTMFRYITDGDAGVLLAQLPDFGMGITEREKEAEHACNRTMGTRIPYTFYKFLLEAGIIEAEKPKEEKVEIGEIAVEDTTAPKFEWLPVVFREFCANCPADFVYPTIVALLPVLGTLATRLRATYLDGREHTTSFISVIFAPQSAGKSFARDIVSVLTKDLRRHDEISILKEKQYKAELKLKKNSDKLPEDPHAPYRLVQAVISVPRLLQRQEDACGLHQLSFTEEIDTITKSNAGGSYAQKSDLYRQAFDNAEYGQDYISVDTFTGSVKLYYNILMLGTPKQLYKFFTDAENGLVSRCAFAELMNQEFAKIPRFKPLTEKQQEAITRVMNRFEEMTYRRKNAQSEEYIVKSVVNVDRKMDEVREALEKWLEDTRKEALKNNDMALDVFRRRAAVKAFRVGMLCVGMYSPGYLSKKLLGKIARFCTDLANEDVRQSVAAFGKMISETGEKTQSGRQGSLLDSLEETFNAGELMVQMRKRDMESHPSKVLYRWKKAGYIKQNDNQTFTKIKK